MRYAAKVDANQAEIVKALRAVGAAVESLAAVGRGVPDLLVCCPGRPLMLMEVKDGSLSPSRRRLTADQERWHSRFPVNVVGSVDEALAVLKT